MHQGRRLRHLADFRQLFAPAEAADADLLARWVVHRDEAAFGLLVRRHGPLVLAACRRLLRDPADVDDAFQAVFLVLARKAATIARGEVVGAWLHRVAFRVALRVRASRVKWANRHDPEAIDQLPAPPDDPARAELRRVLDEEVAKLPERQRIVFVLCCLEGKTGEEAGLLLGCPPGTVSSRLTRAREQLRNRLTRRGFAPSAVVLTALTGDALAGTVPIVLVESVLRIAKSFAMGNLHGGPLTCPAAIAEGVVKTMFVTNLKLIPVLFVAGLLAAGAVLAGTGPKDDVKTDPAGLPARMEPEAPPEAKAKTDEKALPAPPVVRLVKLQVGGLDRVALQSCLAEPGRQARLYPTASGMLKKVYARIGDRVKAGQLLAEIDAEALALDFRQARVAVEQAQGLLKEAEARVATAKVEVMAAKSAVKARTAEMASANENFKLRTVQRDRTKKVFDSGVIPQQTMDEAENQVYAAKGLAEAAVSSTENANVDVVVKESKLDQASAGVATAKANVEAAKVGLEKAELAIAHTRITAPFDGVVAECKCQPGEFVRLGERTDPAPLFTIMQVDVLRIVMSVPKRDVARLEPGLAVEMQFESLSEIQFSGKVASVGFVVEPKSQTVEVEIAMPNAKGEIRPGMCGVASWKIVR